MAVSPWSRPWPDTDSVPFLLLKPLSSVVVSEIAFGTEVTGTRSVVASSSWVTGVAVMMPLASVTYWRSLPATCADCVASRVRVSLDWSMLIFTRKLVLVPDLATTVSPPLSPLTEYVTPGTGVRAEYVSLYVMS